jgi:hypothetical protein
MEYEYCPKSFRDMFIRCNPENIVYEFRYPNDFEVPRARIYTVGWVDIGTGTKVPLRFVTYLSKVSKINEKSVLTK